eukprot:5274589-Pleurochrysis_carterae.AAC.1
MRNRAVPPLALLRDTVAYLDTVPPLASLRQLAVTADDQSGKRLRVIILNGFSHCASSAQGQHAVASRVWSAFGKKLPHCFVCSERSGESFFVKNIALVAFIGFAHYNMKA